MTNTEPGRQDAPLPAETQGTWTLDPSTSSIELHTRAMWGLAKVKARFDTMAGTAEIKPDGESSGTLQIDAASIDTGNKKRDKHLRSADFLESDKYPSIVYTATGARPATDNHVEVSGTLTVHGQTHPLSVLAAIDTRDPAHATLHAEIDLDRADWGITWAKMGAKLANHIVVQAHFVKEQVV